MPEAKANGYAGAAQAALTMIVTACQHDDKDQRHDMIGAAASLFWYAARQSAFTVVRKRGHNMMKDSEHPDEVIAISKAALDNMNKLEKAVDRCAILTELLKGGEAR
jgi:ABC-type enterochelin transport system substrate-binding protein